MEIIKNLKIIDTAYGGYGVGKLDDGYTISCNPSTMARDINILKEKYDIFDFTIIDMFPETYHIENIAVLVQK